MTASATQERASPSLHGRRHTRSGERAPEGRRHAALTSLMNTAVCTGRLAAVSHPTDTEMSPS